MKRSTFLQTILAVIAAPFVGKAKPKAVLNVIPPMRNSYLDGDSPFPDDYFAVKINPTQDNWYHVHEPIDTELGKYKGCYYSGHTKNDDGTTTIHMVGEGDEVHDKHFTKTVKTPKPFI
jgi:hypothetical protein